MTIDMSGEFWRGTEPADLLGIFETFVNDDDLYSVDAARIATCTCRGQSFKCRYFPLNGIGRMTCVTCQTEHSIADADEYWDEASEEEELETYGCPECSSESANIALGLSTYQEDPEGVRWLYLGVRCTGCGLLGWIYDTKVGWGPATTAFLASITPGDIQID